MKKYLIYHVRWQLSGLILVPVAMLVSSIGIESKIVMIVLGNLCGATCFWYIDKLIFRRKT